MSDSKKIVLVGHFGVGKSSLIRRFVMNAFSDDYKVTIGVQILKKEITIQGKNLTFIIWDIEGKEELQQIRPSYLLGTSGFIYVIDPTRATTYSNLNDEIKYIKSNFAKAAIVSVANKSDLIDTKEFEEKLSKNNLSVDFYSSAKTGENVNHIFEQLGINLLEL
jgi:small GTP-binding protein